jgi:hypothetical protein
MKLSEKCRSGRERLRLVSHRPSGRGGNTLQAFGHDERVAAEGDGDVMVPGDRRSMILWSGSTPCCRAARWCRVCPVG